MHNSAFPPVQFDEYPFPFVGAGEAQYFEWAEVHVVFERPPTDAEQAKIAETVPPPLRDSVDFDGAFLVVASDQFAHMTMAEAYEADPGDAGLDEDSDGDSRFFFAAGSQVRKFNEDTERWLKAAHEICPILVAFRAEDWEAGGTDLSPWHTWSVQRSEEILSGFDRAVADDDEHPGNFMLTRLLGVLEDEERPIPAAFADVVSPGEAEVALLQSGDAEGLFELLSNRNARLEPTIERLVAAIDSENPDHRRAMSAIIRFLNTLEDPPTDALQALAKAVLEGEDGDEMLAPLCEAAAKTHWGISYLGAVAYQMLQAKRWLDAARLYDVAVTHDCNDLSLYNNALYGVMADNTGLDVQPERARKYIEAARPHAEQNPSIFYNIACIEMELGDEDAVLENCRLALEHGYSKPQQIRDEEVFGDLRQDPRFMALFDD